VLEAGCNADGRGKFRDAEETQPALAAEGDAFIGAIYGEEEKAPKLRVGRRRVTRTSTAPDTTSCRRF
jgi:hypothetical protein